MTGYGQAAGENETYRVAVTARSVNHRFLDLSIRIGDDYRVLESNLRQLAAARLLRGRVEIRVAIEDLSGGEASVSIDENLVGELLAATARLDREGIDEAALSIGDVLRLPEVVRVRRDQAGFESADRELVLTVAAGAVDRLLEMRSVEGGQLESILAERLELLGAVVVRLEGERAEVRARLLENMKGRVEELMEGQEIAPERLAQETAILAEKIDIQEELDRLGAHLETFAAAMREDEAIGRRLDFLAQEIHRELNTLGSKCRDAQMAEWIVDGKVICEQLREQVQNVE